MLLKLVTISAVLIKVMPAKEGCLNIRFLCKHFLYCISVKYCGDPGDISDGTKTGTYYVNDVVTYTCNVGYELPVINGVSVGNITCDVNATWSALPTCTSRYHTLI